MEHCTYCNADVMTLDGHVCEDDLYGDDLCDWDGDPHCIKCGSVSCTCDDEDMEDYLNATTCPVCEGEGAYMGSLGDSPWFRCIHCGMEYTEDGLRSQGPIDLTVAEEDA